MASVEVQRPNILWLVSEDNSPEYLGPYGDPLARTPTIDALALDGVVYDNCFVTAPVCAPSRFSIITGMYASSFAPANHMRADGNVLDKPDGSPADASGGWGGLRYLDNLPPWARGFPAYLREIGYHCTNNAKEDYNAAVDVADAWDDSSPLAHWNNRADRAQPFFAVFNLGITHESSLHPGGPAPLPGGVDPDEVRLPSYHPDVPEIRADRALYYDLNTRLDAEIADRLAELEADGLADDTIVCYYGDHGGCAPRSKRFCYDSGLRVPLIVRVPERWKHLWPSAPGSRVGDIVNLMDLAPTMLSLAGLEAPGRMHGRAFAGRHAKPAPEYTFAFRDRMGPCYDMVRTARDRRYRYIRNFMPHLPHGQYSEYLFRQAGVRAWRREYLAGRLDAAQSAFWEPKPFEELYDLTVDRDEVVNLAGQSEYEPVLHRMRAALDEHMLRTCDNGFIPEGSELQTSNALGDPDVYPLERVMRLAGLTAQRAPAYLGRFIEALSDNAEPVRYWAALGCLLLDERAGRARDVLAERVEHDPSPSVRIAAAEAVCRVGDTRRAPAVLEDLAHNHRHPRIRLQAMRALDNVRNARPAGASVRR